jgi:hypothetical protein
MQPSIAQGPPSLRLTELSIAGFRTFGQPTVMPLVQPGELVADTGTGSSGSSVVVLQGEGGAGKSNAFAALDFFFKATIAVLAAGTSTGFEGALPVTWDLLTAVGHHDVLVRQRDRHPGPDAPIEIAARFVDGRGLRLRVVPAGTTARLSLEWVGERQSGRAGERGSERGPERAERGRLTARECAELLAQLEAPYGPGSRPVALLSARRRAAWLPDEPQSSLLPSGMATQLYWLRSSLSPSDRQRWRMFCDLLGRFEAFAGRDVSVDRLDAGAPQVTIEDRGRVVLPLSELASSEQHVVVICAALLLCRAPLLCIEKPELGLDGRTQRLLFEVLDGFARAGFVDQLLLESNSPAFATPCTLRLSRPSRGEGAATRVERAPAEATGGQSTVARRAKAQGAEERWVTREGYTQLPEAMRRDLGLENGRKLWFLKRKAAWEAWPEDRLEHLLGKDGEGTPA